MGVTLTFFNSDLFGTRINALSAGNIVFNYTEGTDTISISNKALSDEEGKTQSTYFDFEVSLESELPETINYNIYLEKDETSTIEDKAIKVYLTNQEDVEIESVKRVNTLLPIKQTNRKRIYATSINSQGPKTIQKYRLRVWLDKDYDLTNVEKADNGQHIIAEEKTYKFRVGVNNEKISNLSSSWKSKTENEYNFLALYTLDTVELPETYTFENEEYTLDKTADVSEQQNNGVILGEYKNGDKVIAVMGQDGGVIAPQNSGNLFSGSYPIIPKYKTINLNNFNTSNVTNMNSMFEYCSSLTGLSLISLDTSNVTSMYLMFRDCRGLISLDLSPLNTNKVTDMRNMFISCSNLISIDLSNFNTINVKNMSCMFYGCSGLTNLDLSSLTTSNVIDMSGMFRDCSALIELDLNNFNTINVKNMNSMFSDCSSLTGLDLSPLDTSKVTNMSCMFYGCSGLTNLDLSPLDTSNVTDMSGMFSNCSSLTGLDLSPLNTSKVTNMRSMFSRCSSITNLDLSMLNLDRLTTIASTSTSINVDIHQGMFYSCTNLETLDITGLDTNNIKSMKALFYNCPKLTIIKVGCGWDMTNVTNTTNMFSNCGVSSVTKVCNE